MFSDLSGDQKGVLLMNAAKIVPSIIGFNTAAKANNKQQGYLDDIKKLEGQRQTLVNPYAKVSNPYQNLAVATRAAEMQAEQTDLALANTLDQLRQTGAGGATALAQAALKSKQGISASIQTQEVQNQKLEAQGQLQADLYAAQGQAGIMKMQEEREEAQLDRLQGLADIEAMQKAAGTSTGIGSVMSGLSGAAQAFIKPKAQDFGDNQDYLKYQTFGASLDGPGVTTSDYGYGNVPDGTVYGFSDLNDPDSEMSWAPGTQ